MGISYVADKRSFHLQAGEMSYLSEILNTGHLAHLYWGKKLRKDTDLSHHIRMEQRQANLLSEEANNFSLDNIPQEYPSYGHTDFRQPAYQIQLENGSTVSDLKYCSHEIIKGREGLKGLPSTYIEDKDEAETLEINLLDELAGLKVILSYTAYEDLNVITRSVCFVNTGRENINLQRALSMSVDFMDDKYQLLHLSGNWIRECQLNRIPLALSDP